MSLGREDDLESDPKPFMPVPRSWQQKEDALGSFRGLNMSCVTSTSEAASAPEDKVAEYAPHRGTCNWS